MQGVQPVFFRFASPWGTGIIVTGAVISTNSFGPGFGDTIVLRLIIGLS